MQMPTSAGCIQNEVQNARVRLSARMLWLELVKARAMTHKAGPI